MRLVDFFVPPSGRTFILSPSRGGVVLEFYDTQFLIDEGVEDEETSLATRRFRSLDEALDVVGELTEESRDEAHRAWEDARIAGRRLKLVDGRVDII